MRGTTVNEAATTTLKAWESFYVIVGSSAGALTGLQFVVLTLITEAGAIRGSAESLSAFGSPNVVHFCSALLASAIMSAPWGSMGPPAVALGLGGACGFVYSVAVLRIAMRQRDYKPVLEDWVWHTGLPMLAYAALVVAGIRLPRDVAALYVIGGAALLLVFIGIHNAWDTVAYVIFERAREQKALAAAARAKEHHAAHESPVGPAKRVESHEPHRPEVRSRDRG